MSTHIRNNAKFAKTVFMPGDPYRAKWMAETFLSDYELVTDVRGILGFTGHLKSSGKLVSIMASGMGVPSIGIYSFELYSYYGVETIIRVGTCGGYQPECHVGDVIIATGASSNSCFADHWAKEGIHVAPSSDFMLTYNAYTNAVKLGHNVHVGPIFSSDIFYDPNPEFYKIPQELGILAVEMESYGLFINAMRLKKRAACILTVSDSFTNKGERDLTQEERQENLVKMMELAFTLA